MPSKTRFCKFRLPYYNVLLSNKRFTSTTGNAGWKYYHIFSLARGDRSLELERGETMLTDSGFFQRRKKPCKKPVSTPLSYFSFVTREPAQLRRPINMVPIARSNPSYRHGRCGGQKGMRCYHVSEALFKFCHLNFWIFNPFSLHPLPPFSHHSY